MTIWTVTSRLGSATIVSALLALSAASPARAADAEHGRQFANRVCSVCHQIAPGRPGGVAPAPPFASIAKSKQFRAKRAKLLWEAHGTMPNLALTADEAADVAEYISSLARPRPAAK